MNMIIQYKEKNCKNQQFFAEIFDFLTKIC